MGPAVVAGIPEQIKGGNMKVRIGKPDIADILTELVDIDKFPELENWDEEAFSALTHFVHGCVTNKTKHTSCVFLAWNELKSKEQELLLTLMDKRALGHMGILCSTMLPVALAKNSVAVDIPEEMKADLKKALKSFLRDKKKELGLEEDD